MNHRIHEVNPTPEDWADFERYLKQIEPLVNDPSANVLIETDLGRMEKIILSIGAALSIVAFIALLICAANLAEKWRLL